MLLKNNQECERFTTHPEQKLKCGFNTFDASTAVCWPQLHLFFINKHKLFSWVTSSSIITFEYYLTFWGWHITNVQKEAVSGSNVPLYLRTKHSKKDRDKLLHVCVCVCLPHILQREVSWMEEESCWQRRRALPQVSETHAGVSGNTTAPLQTGGWWEEGQGGRLGERLVVFF